MNTEISKQQFIVISIIVIIVTVIILIIIGKNSAEKNNDAQVLASNSNIESNISQIANENIENIENNENEISNSSEEMNIENVINNSSEGIDIEKEINNNSEEIDIDGNEIKIIEQKVDKIFVAYDEMIKISDDEIETYFGIKTDNFEKYIVKMGSGKFDSRLYMIFKPVEDKSEEAKEQIREFLIQYLNLWEKIDIVQAQLIENKKAVERNGYLIYIISNDNEAVMEEIRTVI